MNFDAALGRGRVAILKMHIDLLAVQEEDEELDLLVAACEQRLDAEVTA